MTTKLTVEKQYDLRPKTWIRVLINVIVLAILVIPSLATIEFSGVSESGLLIAKNIIIGLFTPSMEMITNLSSSGLLYLLFETAAIAFLGTLIGTVISIPLAFLSSRNITPKWINVSCSVLITIIRTFPVFVYGLMFIRVTGPGAFAGVLTMALTSIGMLSKLFIESIEDLDVGITEALDASGCTTIQKIRFGIIPQLMSNLVSIVIYRFDINVKNASVLGIVGAGGIGAPLQFGMASGKWHEVGALLLGLIALVLCIEYVSTKIRIKLAKG